MTLQEVHILDDLKKVATDTPTWGIDEDGELIKVVWAGAYESEEYYKALKDYNVQGLKELNREFKRRGLVAGMGVAIGRNKWSPYYFVYPEFEIGIINTF